MKQRQKIFIDGLGLVDGHFSGIGQYILGIIRGIDELIDDAKHADQPTPEVTVIIPRDMVGKFQAFNFKHIGFKTFPLSFRIMNGLWYRDKLPPMDLWYGKGTYIFPHFVGMPLLFSKSAMVIFDMSYELHQKYSDEGNAVFLSKRVRQTLKTTSKVITISQNARKEIVEFYKIEPSKVVVATPAVDLTHFYKRSTEEIDRIKRKYDIRGDYILALSNLEPRKNLDGLVDAYCNLPKSVTDKYGLLLVGVSGWKTEALFNKIIKKVKQGYNILRPSQYVTDKDKPAIISGAKLLVYPSHYEGFGMPPLEALACGVPVITADNSSLPEVVEGVGKMVRSSDTRAITRAIQESLEKYQELSQKILKAGPKQAEKFSWKKSAQVFIDIAKEIEK